jgi:hypothetical protein
MLGQAIGMAVGSTNFREPRFAYGQFRSMLDLDAYRVMWNCGGDAPLKRTNRVRLLCGFCAGLIDPIGRPWAEAGELQRIVAA